MAYNILDTQDDYASPKFLTQETLLTTTVTEINGHGHGFKADIYVDDGMPEHVTFEIAHVFDGKTSENGEESVGLLLSPKAARMLAQRLNEAANAVEYPDNY